MLMVTRIWSVKAFGSGLFCSFVLGISYQGLLGVGVFDLMRVFLLDCQSPLISHTSSSFNGVNVLTLKTFILGANPSKAPYYHF